MAYPRFIDEVALASDPFDVTQVYTDLSVRTRVRSFARGRQKETVQPDPGRSSTTFEDSDRALDPVNAASIYYPNVLPMRRIRARVQGWLSEVAAAALTVAGNEVTDATRAASAALGTGSSGQMCDGLSNDSSFGIRRAATNLFRRGQCDATTDWGQENSGAPAAIDATVVPPFSSQSIKYPCDGTVASQGCLASSATGQAAAAAVVGVGSIYFKGAVGQSYQHRLRWTNTDASVTLGTLTTFAATGAIQLLIPTSLAVAAGKTGDKLSIEVVINGTRTETFNVAHPMLEKGVGTVAPYVATSGGATATHAAGRVQAPASLLDETQGWVAARVRMGYPSVTASVPPTSPSVFAFQDSGSERLRAVLVPSSTQWQMIRQSASGAGVVSVNAPLVAFAAGDILTLIFQWTATQIMVSVNGAAFTKAANTFIPTLAASTFDIGNASAGSQLDSDVLWFACGSGTLTDADAAAINAFGITDKNPEEFNDASSFRGSCQATMPFDTAAYRVIKDAVLYTNFVDTEQGWLIDQLGPGQAEAIAPANDGFDVLNTFKLSSTQTYPQQTAGARIVAILDTQGWPAAERSIDVVSQQSLVQAAVAGDLADVSALSAIQAAAANDNGIFYIDGRGYAVFLGRHRETDPRWATSQATFCDKANFVAGRILYKSITPSSSRIRNEYRVTRNGGTEQVWPVGGTSPSITKYRLRSEAVSTLHTSDGEALNYAQYRVLLDKDPHRRYDEMTITPLDDTAMWRVLLGLAIGDRITVFNTPPGGGAADQRDMLIEGISATIGPGVESSWTYRLSPVSDQGGWVLGHAVYGLLGSTTVLTY